MSKPTMETLARRLERVERGNRRLKMVGAVALAVIFLAGCQQKTEFEKCIEYLEKEQGPAKTNLESNRRALICSGKVR